VEEAEEASGRIERARKDAWLMHVIINLIFFSHSFIITGVSMGLKFITQAVSCKLRF
jgi:hypothetical protein